MSGQSQANNITRAWEAEASAYSKSGWAWLAFSPLVQSLLFLWFRKTEQMQTSTVVCFILFSLPLAWWPLARGIRHLLRARRMNNPQDLLRRALTTEAQLIAHIDLGTHTTIWLKLVNLVLTLLSAEAHSLQHSWDQYGVTGYGETSSIRLPCLVVTLTNNRAHRLTTTKDSAKLKELIAALRAHAPHATPAPKPEATKGEWLIEASAKSTRRLVMLLLGVPLLLLGSTVVFAQYMNGRARADLEQHGVRTTATVSSLSDYGGAGSDYHVVVDFTDQYGKAINAGTVQLVTKADYAQLKVGAPVEIVYPLRDPRDFRLAASLQRLDADKSSFIAFSILSLSGLIMVLIAVVSIVLMALRQQAGGSTPPGTGNYGVNPPVVL